MKKSRLKALLESREAELIEGARQLALQRSKFNETRKIAEDALKQVAHLKANWRPVPMTHEWTPRKPQCALCDDPRDSARHQTRPGPAELVALLTERFESANGAMRHWKAGELAGQAVQVLLGENVTPES